jgi:hypothetical protein
MAESIIGERAINRRAYWIEEISKLSGDFGGDTERLSKELTDEIASGGITTLMDHLRLCGDIPENYHHDSSEEKLYSKYTDILLSLSFKAIGLRSIVLAERADAADVEAFGKSFSFVADAKAFRLSRTAKNQKDFKIQAMDGWKRDKTYAIVVCPIYQLPVKSSQIYQQATSRNVCILTYSHLVVLLAYALIDGKDKAENLLHEIFKSVPLLNPSKDATSYWTAINRTMLHFSSSIDELWRIEKKAAVESIAAAKEEALRYLANERTKIMQMSHEEALLELVRVHKLENKIRTIKSLSDNRLLEIR